MTRVAAIDCGTNSIRLLVSEVTPTGPVEIARRTTMVRLGQGVDATGEFHPDALARTFAACDDYARIMTEVGGVDAIRFVATSAARDAANSHVFFAGVHERFGVMPDIVAGPEEARLSFAGAASGLVNPEDPVLVIDIGGGSTELVRGLADGRVLASQSLDMGAVRLRERFLHDDPPTADQVAAARRFVGGLLDGCRVPLEGVGTFVGVAGTVTTMGAAVKQLPVYDRSQVHGTVLSPQVVHETAVDWLTRTVESLRTIPSMHPQRAEIICAGALILDEIMSRVARPLRVSESDILDGITADLVAMPS
ncbi:exopolyphosphatase [Propionibacteriaceae bacterium G57]|uniref:Ppx/GppA phosphatase family protein n=1 Tax=Aestuariimicrobium sp. G57 TaxID=3418485 RepID=UPI003DA6D03B